MSPLRFEFTSVFATLTNAKVHDLKVFYREAGSWNDSTLLLLHGFPTSSHMFRQLIPALADRYHVVAPDLPGFGFTETPELEGSATLQIAFLSGS
jgi:pimeloyl-ACP methyl ester carboxylesterase